MHFCGSFDARNGIAFEQEAENHFSFFDWEVHPIQRLVAGIRENLSALGALVALAGAAFTEFAAFRTAVVTGHCEISY
jgi:hypothetical protein